MAVTDLFALLDGQTDLDGAVGVHRRLVAETEGLELSVELLFVDLMQWTDDLGQLLHWTSAKRRREEQKLDKPT